MTDNEKLKRVYDEFTTVWKFFKKYSDVKSDDEFWESVVAEAAAINQKYHCSLCRDLILAVLGELERSSKINGEVISNDR